MGIVATEGSTDRMVTILAQVSRVGKSRTKRPVCA
jgi:hypothetical protein